jgi:hypothetical protein
MLRQLLHSSDTRLDNFSCRSDGIVIQVSVICEFGV